MEGKIVQKDRRKKHQRPRVLHGYVLNLEGAKIPNAKVEALHRGLNKMESYTDSSGYFAFYEVSLGFYEVTGSAKGYSSQTKMAQIMEKKSAALIFELFGRGIKERKSKKIRRKSFL